MLGNTLRCSVPECRCLFQEHRVPGALPYTFKSHYCNKFTLLGCLEELLHKSPSPPPFMVDAYNICARQLDITVVLGETNFSLGVL
jgi:hypothetical protein